MTMTITPDVIEKKLGHHDVLAVTINDAAPWNAAQVQSKIKE